MKSNDGETLTRDGQMRKAHALHLQSWPNDKKLAELHWKWLQAEYAISPHHAGTIKPEAKAAERTAAEAMQAFLDEKARRRN